MMKLISYTQPWRLVSYLLILGVLFLANGHYQHSVAGGPTSIVHLRSEYDLGGGVWDESFMSEPQKLSQERLNLNVWGGFHELKLDRVFDSSAFQLSFDFSLSTDSYIYIYLDRSNEQRSYGIRVSRNKMFPSIFFIRDGDGKFLVKNEININIQKELSHIQVFYNKPAVVVKIDEATVFHQSDLSEMFSDGIVVAWGGSYERTPVYIDNIKVIDENNQSLFYTNFGSFNSFSLSKYILLPLAIFAIYSLILRATRSTPQYEIFININLIATLTAVYLLYYFVFSSRYYVEPGMSDHDITQYYNQIEKENLVDLENSKKKKIFFYGGSKTYGDGASSQDKTWVNLLTSDLKTKLTGDSSLYKFINWGVPSAKTSHLLELHQRLIHYAPVMTVLLIGVNDNDSNIFYRNVQKIIELNRKKNIYTILLEELTYINRLEDLASNDSFQNFQKIRPLCAQQRVTCIGQYDKVYDSKEKLYDTGIRWVEWVHFNSYGQKLFASIVEPEVFKILKHL